MMDPYADILFAVHIAKETKRMNLKKALGLAVGILMAVACMAQVGARGKAELKAGSGNITIDYGQPSMKGRDMLSQLKVGDFWRVGTNQATVIKTPVELTFGSTKVPKGDYSLWVKRATEEKFELVFNSQTGQWGTQHDASKDVYTAPLKKEAVTEAVDVLSIKLTSAAKGGVLAIIWGTSQLKAEFQFPQ
jgi:hypothetical protein